MMTILMELLWGYKLYVLKSSKSTGKTISNPVLTSMAYNLTLLISLKCTTIWLDLLISSYKCIWTTQEFINIALMHLKDWEKLLDL